MAQFQCHTSLLLLTCLIIYNIYLLAPVYGKTRCIFGDEPDCTFKCHCAGDSNNCDRLTGTCPQGCEKGKPVGYGNWQSDGCQLSNVAYGKPTFSNTVINRTSRSYNRPHLWYNTNYTVDGLMKLQVFDGSCTVVYTSKKTTLPWLMVDLQATYTIPKVILVNTDNSIDSSYLEDFYVKIGNSSNFTEQTVCKKFYRRIRSAGKETITCDKPLTGRYVTIAKYEERNKVGRLPLCEFIVLGYKAINVEWEKCYEKSSYNMYCKKCMGTIPPDCLQKCPENSYGMYCEGICGNCQNGTKCDEITGKCDACQLGWKPPKCDTQCPNNTYGYSCEKNCGSCADNAQCNLESGFCPKGCKLWYADEDRLCKTSIPVQDLHNVPKVFYVTDTWAMFVMENFGTPVLQKYYKVKLYYLHENNPLASLQEYTNFKVHFGNETTKLKIKIEMLIPNTQYWFEVQVFRQHKNASEGGERSPIVNIMTKNRKNQDNDNNPQHIKGENTHSAGVNTSAVKQPLPHHHVSTLTIVLNLVVLVVLATVGVIVGIYFYRKYKAKKGNDNLTHLQRAQNNMSYDVNSATMVAEYDNHDYRDIKPMLGR